MKKTNLKLLLLQTSVAVLVATLAGCASSDNYKKGDTAGTGLKEAASAIAAGEIKIQGALTALTNLVSSQQGDLVPKFEKFNTAVTDLQSTAQEVKDRVAAMRQAGNEYFKQWDQQAAAIKNEDIKGRSEARKQEMQAKFDAVKRSYAEVQIAFGPFNRDLKDIQTALGTDLTAGGLNAIKGVAEKANQNGQVLKTSVAQLSAHFKDLGVAMSALIPTSEQPATPPAK